MENFRLNLHPTESTISAFYPALKSEYEQQGCGMYCEWGLIEKRFQKGQIITLEHNTDSIAFVTWNRNKKIVEMDVIWTLPQHRRKGYGLNFTQLLIKEFRKRGDVALTLYCATYDGVSLAKRAGFNPQKKQANLNPNVELYTPYIKILKNTEAVLLDGEDLYVQCFEEYHQDDSLFCKIPLNADFSKKPVYFHVNEDWECKVVLGDKIIMETSLKYILKALNIRIYNHMVALFDHNITIPSFWVKH